MIQTDQGVEKIHTRMETDFLREEIHEIIRQSEINAIVRELRAGRSPRIGEIVDYYIESNGCAAGLFGPRSRDRKKPEIPYRLQVEQWHLDEARRLLNAV